MRKKLNVDSNDKKIAPGAIFCYNTNNHNNIFMSYNEFFARNLGFLTPTDQQKIKKLSIGIAGAGGDGGLLAERLARFGVGKLVLAEPDCFEPANINRQYACNTKNFNKNKALVVAKELQLINPDLEIVIFDRGINENNVVDFVAQSDIVIDEIEYSLPKFSVMLAQVTRKYNKYLFMGANIGWGASIFCFSPKGMTFEKYFKYNEAEQTIDPLQYVGKIPKYFEKKLLAKILSGQTTMPSLSSSVGLVASFVSSQVILFALGKIKPVLAPNFWFVDAGEMKLEKRHGLDK